MRVQSKVVILLVVVAAAATLVDAISTMYFLSNNLGVEGNLEAAALFARFGVPLGMFVHSTPFIVAISVCVIAYCVVLRTQYFADTVCVWLPSIPLAIIALVCVLTHGVAGVMNLHMSGVM